MIIRHFLQCTIMVFQIKVVLKCYCVDRTMNFML